MALHLNEEDHIGNAVEAVPLASVSLVARSVPMIFLRRYGTPTYRRASLGLRANMMVLPPPCRLLVFISVCVAKSPHVEFYLQWALSLLQHHGRVRCPSSMCVSVNHGCDTTLAVPQAIRTRGAPMLAALRALQRSVLVHKDTLTKLYVSALPRVVFHPALTSICMLRTMCWVVQLPRQPVHAGLLSLGESSR